MWKFFTALVFNLFFVSILCCGCMGKSVPVSDGTMINGKPHWYWQPSADGVIGGVGVAGFNINGPTAQRQLAIDRALGEISRQKGVSVSQIQEITQTATQNSSSVEINSYSIHSVDGTVVTATVRDIWQDPKDNRIFVWVTESK